MTNYKVVSELRTNGQLIDIPDGAENVTVEPTARPGIVRVTYLKHLQTVPFGAESEEPRPMAR